MYEAFIMNENLSLEGNIQVNTEEAAIALNELTGKDMSWKAYYKISSAIIELDRKVKDGVSV